MKWFAAVLMVVNVLVFLGISDRKIESPVAPGDIRPDVNRESMLLLKEMDSALSDPATSASEGGAAGSDDSGIDSTPGGDDDGLPTTVLEEGALARVTIGEGGVVNREQPDRALLESGGSDSVDGGSADTAGRSIGGVLCYRVGPFRGAEDWDAAVRWVEQRSWSWKQVRSASRELRAVRVYIGPYESIGAAQPTIELLKEKNLDHFVYLRDGNARVSLGYFTQEELAVKYVNYLTGQGIDARSQPEYRTLGPFNWMDIRVESGEAGELLGKQWDTEGVNVSEKSCPART